MAEWLSVGTHRYSVDGDTLFWVPDGPVSAAHAILVCSLLEEIGDRCGYVLWLVDAYRSQALSYDARRVYSQRLMSRGGYLALASFGAGLAARTTARLTLHAAQLLGRYVPPNENFIEEADARRYLDGYRKRFKELRNAEAI